MDASNILGADAAKEEVAAAVEREEEFTEDDAADDYLSIEYCTCNHSFFCTCLWSHEDKCLVCELPKEERLAWKRANLDGWVEKERAYYEKDAAAAAAAAATKPTLPAGHVIAIRTTTRAHSSGYENNNTELYSTYEAASAAILAEFEEGGMALEYWCEDDCYEDAYDCRSGNAESLPEPSSAWAYEKFNPAALKALNIEGSWEQKLYGPFSDFCQHCPYELHIACCRIK